MEGKKKGVVIEESSLEEEDQPMAPVKAVGFADVEEPVEKGLDATKGQEIMALLSKAAMEKDDVARMEALIELEKKMQEMIHTVQVVKMRIEETSAHYSEARRSSAKSSSSSSSSSDDDDVDNEKVDKPVELMKSAKVGAASMKRTDLMASAKVGLPVEDDIQMPSKKVGTTSGITFGSIIGRLTGAFKDPEPVPKQKGGLEKGALRERAPAKKAVGAPEEPRPNPNEGLLEVSYMQPAIVAPDVDDDDEDARSGVVPSQGPVSQHEESSSSDEDAPESVGNPARDGDPLQSKKDLLVQFAIYDGKRVPHPDRIFTRDACKEFFRMDINPDKNNFTYEDVEKAGAINAYMDHINIKKEVLDHPVYLALQHKFRIEDTILTQFERIVEKQDGKMDTLWKFLVDLNKVLQRRTSDSTINTTFNFFYECFHAIKRKKHNLFWERGEISECDKPKKAKGKETPKKSIGKKGKK